MGGGKKELTDIIFLLKTNDSKVCPVVAHNPSAAPEQPEPP